MSLTDEICAANEAVVVFNVETIQQNTQWIESGIDASEATTESNDVLTSENEARYLQRVYYSRRCSSFELLTHGV